MPGIGKLLVIVGLVLVVVGLLVWFLGNKFTWFGHLPGDVRYESKNVRIYFPWVTMLLLSALLSLILWVVRRF